MTKLLIAAIKEGLRVFNIEVSRISKPSDFTQLETSPFFAYYKTAGKRCLISFPTRKLSIGWYFICGRGHVYEQALRFYIKTKDFDSIKKTIQKYSELVQFCTANDKLGLSITDGVFTDEDSPFATPFPWDSRNKKEMEIMRSQNIIRENKKRNGGNVLATLNYNTTNEIVLSESNILKKLLESFEQGGYKETEDYITINVLVNNSAYMAYVIGGNHRVAVMSALGYEKVPALLNKIVRREDVEHWPNVVNGLYSKEAALKVFDRVFHAEPPPVFSHWLSSASFI